MSCISQGATNFPPVNGRKRKKSHKSNAHALVLVRHLASEQMYRETQKSRCTQHLEGWLCISQSLVVKYAGLLLLLLPSEMQLRSVRLEGTTLVVMSSLLRHQVLRYSSGFETGHVLPSKHSRFLVLLGAYSSISLLLKARNHPSISNQSLF